MFRTMFDSDVTTFSPMGRLHQIEYAQEAVKQGGATLGLRSDEHVVIAGLLRQTKKLSGHQPKLFVIDDHMAVSIAGLTADARLLIKYMRTECLNNKYVFDSPLQVATLVADLADKAQSHTQDYSSRPYGVGLLVAGYDKSGPHLFETSPSGSAYDFRAQAIGARSQSARTYLERHYETFADASLEELITHALTALRETAGDTELTAENASIMIVGKDTPAHELAADDIAARLAALGGGAAAEDDAANDDDEGTNENPNA
ncbi:proteasome subunit alpha type [Thecamonas trahens ATCC 50062]|uniref:Proteasome subunit alpha type n=1 Tax=Thecamonas trahens ATCC 50062 TaxID=461836 RepID=A0A0L0DHG1_THETB|nr:proteasome subunit alpha type [Thecamonas trahens ATCC 50062]KNC51804.1 proteasome subunit alpha type [Thecamonas trahens ATCC 50062]|eukprot:XP_013755671.1 proteasome subunit alpha type [Thecamonas trahens ATCC 50062]